jgi:Arc/MetJ-type ribon-helix-helix transcriptional regulator
MSTYPPEIENYVERKIATGQFRSREEFAEEAARVYQALDERHAKLKNDVQAAIDEANAGLSEDLDIDVIKQEIIAEVDENGRLL